MTRWWMIGSLSLLLGALRKQEETGFLRITGNGSRLTRYPSVRLHYAREFHGNGKRIIRLATDRPIGFDKEKNQLVLEYGGTQPVRLTKVSAQTTEARVTISSGDTE